MAEIVEHNQIAKRFMNMCEALHKISATYKVIRDKRAAKVDYPTEDFLDQYKDQNKTELGLHIYHTVFVKRWEIVGQKKVMWTRTGASHLVAPKPNKDDNRLDLPRPIKNALLHLQTLEPNSWYNPKPEMTWLVCWLNNIYPDMSQPGWEAFECSHRCVERDQTGMKLKRIASSTKYGWACIDPDCLCWESRSDNQSRGNTFCYKPCTHEGCTKPNGYVCSCSSLHDPPCI